jgi:hypothetical protein
MSSSAEYRQKAANCQVMAEQCKDDWAKEMWLETAKIWGRLGFQADEVIARKSAPRAFAKARQ